RASGGSGVLYWDWSAVKSNQLPTSRRSVCAAYAACERADVRPRASQTRFCSRHSLLLGDVWPVIHTVKLSLIIGLEGRKVRCFYSAMSTTLIEIRRAKSADAADVAATHDQ